MFDEMYLGSEVREHYSNVSSWVTNMPKSHLLKKNIEVENKFKDIGITFSIGNENAKERIIPFDLIPRVFTNKEWSKIEKGVVQRSIALNAFLSDIYNKAEIVKAGIIPEEVIYKKSSFELAMANFNPPRNIYSPIIGVDLVRTGADEFNSY